MIIKCYNHLMKTEQRNNINNALVVLETELINQGLWGKECPTAKQLASQEPFCVDTMAFEQWLQWVFIPKLSELLKQPSFNGLPNRSDIHTIAEYLFEKYPENTDKITDSLKQIDELLNQFLD